MKTRSEKFREQVLAEHELRPDEMLILDEVCSTLDALDKLPEDAFVEARQNRIVLARLIAQLGFTDPSEGESAADDPAASARGRRAANIRWDRARQQGFI
jgi:hypothetical protein